MAEEITVLYVIDKAIEKEIEAQTMYRQLAEGSEDPVAVVLSRCDKWDVAGGLALTEAAGMEIRHGVDWTPISYRNILQAPDLKALLPVIVGLPQVLRLLEPELKGRLH